MTRDEFLARCATAWDASLITEERLRLLRDWTDAVARIEAAEFGRDHLSARQQREIWEQFLARERYRLRVDEHLPHGYVPTLSNDPQGKALVDLAALLAHPCQLCGTDRDAWWTRTAFCPHWERTP